MKAIYRPFIFILNFIFFPGYSASDTPKSPRTFVSVKQAGSDVEVEFKLPEGRKQRWNLKKEESGKKEKVIEVPEDFVRNDSLILEVKMVSKEREILPCQISARNLSQYDRTYFCRTHPNYQPIREEVKVRVFTKRPGLL